ncbi:hypothetical protein DPMN_033956 [Dreissena polymorpha]|uniref:Uncharacterized protein n=1 Tax=Dreissena polymorpha TaxID=45954 RepID=A0A9D4RJA6_DREPO|nr:hypothetical protein DPMN_033956 [Dreissena polymorpha]
MAHGVSNYNFRHTSKRKTLNLSDSGKSLSEKDRVRRRIEELEKQRRTEDELTTFQQRDEMIQLRRAASSVQIDAETDNAISDSGTDEEFDILAETSKLQDKLAQLQDEQQYIGERENISVTPKGCLPKVKSRTDENRRTEDSLDPKTEKMHLKWDLRIKTEEIIKLNKLLLSSEKKISLLQLELKENKFNNFEEIEKRDLRLKRHEEQFMKLQHKLDDRLMDLEERESKPF